MYLDPFADGRLGPPFSVEDSDVKRLFSNTPHPTPYTLHNILSLVVLRIVPGRQAAPSQGVMHGVLCGVDLLLTPFPLWQVYHDPFADGRLGPPFSVEDSDVKRLFSDNFSVSRLQIDTARPAQSLQSVYTNRPRFGRGAGWWPNDQHGKAL